MVCFVVALSPTSRPRWPRAITPRPERRLPPPFCRLAEPPCRRNIRFAPTKAIFARWCSVPQYVKYDISLHCCLGAFAFFLALLHTSASWNLCVNLLPMFYKKPLPSGCYNKVYDVQQSLVKWIFFLEMKKSTEREHGVRIHCVHPDPQYKDWPPQALTRPAVIGPVNLLKLYKTSCLWRQSLTWMSKLCMKDSDKDLSLPTGPGLSSLVSWVWQLFW